MFFLFWQFVGVLVGFYCVFKVIDFFTPDAPIPEPVSYTPPQPSEYVERIPCPVCGGLYVCKRGCTF
jgi:hypothetical protein